MNIDKLIQRSAAEILQRCFSPLMNIDKLIQTIDEMKKIVVLVP